MADARKLRWLAEAEEKDYAAAANYLSLLVSPADVADLIASLRASPYLSWRAKDILRAARLPLLDAKQSEEVAEKVAKIRDKEALSPILLVAAGRSSRTQIADGYHRVCAAYLSHEDTLVPGRIAYA